MDGPTHLAAIIVAHLRAWEPEPPHVELAIFGTGDAGAIARALDRFCREHLGVGAARGLFYQSSIGSVSGIALADGRKVVVKAHQPNRSRDFLAEIVRIQSFLAERGVFATPIVAGPAPLGHGHAIVEAYTDLGQIADAHDPGTRRALAEGLQKIVATCDPFVASTTLGPTLLTAPDRALWPTPHSRLFDFEATGRGAEWIDEIAALARARMKPAGRRVIGHNDWRQEHVRFVAGRPAAAFDWDSLCCDFEPALLGVAAHAFCADWSLADHRQAPTLAEAQDFIAAYETARGEAFSRDERTLCGAAFAYSCAYTSRCGHALGPDERGRPGTFQHLLWTERARLMDV